MTLGDDYNTADDDDVNFAAAASDADYDGVDYDDNDYR